MSEAILSKIVGNIGDYTTDSILITKSQPLSKPGPEIVWCNKTFTAMTGYTLDEVKGLTPRILQGPETDHAARQEIRSRLDKWANTRVEIKNFTKRGEPFWVDLSIVPVADETGWYHYWVAIQRDITERKLTELAIKEKLKVLSATQERLTRERAEIEGIAAVAEHAQELITVTDTDMRILWANNAFVKRTGYSLSDAQGRYHCDLLDKTSGAFSSREIAIQAILRGEFVHDEVRNVALDGEEFWTDLRISAHRDADGAVERFVLVEREITEQRRLREELHRHRDNLQSLVDQRTAIIRDQADELANALEAQKALNEQQIQFVRMASHEFRTPMTVISMAARRLRNDIGDAAEGKIAQRLTAIDDAVARLDKLVASTLNLAKSDAGKLDCHPVDLHLGDYLARKIEHHAANTGAQEICCPASTPVR